ncbi:MAG: F0F1 ATP synthase subunit gamma [Gammaproteobacteria bacterium]|nr:F0F1 ATP synthase subunit gamma [Gammaproteobacteria bacterium]
MATAKEIKSKIGSVRSTQKITRAMEMIAASKMRRARQRVESSRPFATLIRQVIAHVARSHAEYRHPYLTVRPVKRVGMMVISTDRGLCGGLNINLFRHVLQDLKSWKQKGIAVEVAVIGQKAQHFFKKLDVSIAAVAPYAESPKVENLMGAVQVMLAAFDRAEIDELFLYHNEFVSTIKQAPQVIQLLPVIPDPLDQQLEYHWDYLYEPEARPVMDRLFKRYVEAQVYQGAVENVASEQAARMMAMRNATDNAGEMIRTLKLQYNKARQAMITKELAEIVAGADALE